MDNLLRPLCALLLGGTAGTALSLLHAPVPWLIGPMLTVAFCNIAGARLEVPRWMRSGGQWIIGVALGLHFTPAMVGQMSSYVPYMVLAALAAVAFGTVGGWLMSAFGGVDRVTAHFATAMGGAPEMAVAAERAGASIDQVVMSHMLRVLLTVTIVPAAVQYGAQLTPHVPTSAHGWLPSTTISMLAAFSLAAALAAKHFHFPNAFALVPLFATAGLTATGVADPGMLPRWLSVAAQILIAVSLGARFNPESLVASRRLLIPVAVYSVCSIAFAAAAGVALSRVTGLPIPAAVLSLAPGGMADMGIAADSLGLLVPVVTGFHVIRVAFVVLMTSPVFGWMQSWQRHRYAGK